MCRIVSLLNDLHKTIKIFVINALVQLCINQLLKVIGDKMSSLFNNYTNCIVRGILFYFKRLVKIEQVEDWCKEKILLEVLELLVCQGCSSKLRLIGYVMKWFSKLREVSCKLVIKVNATHNISSSKVD